MIFWSPRVLKCQIYENNRLVDLSKLHEVALEELVKAICPLWKTSSGSYVIYDVQMYQREYMFKNPDVTIEVESFVSDPNKASGKKQIPINKMFLETRFGKRFTIQPRNTAVYKWSDLVEVIFVA